MRERLLATSKLNVTFEGVPAHAGSNPKLVKAHSWQPVMPQHSSQGFHGIAKA